MTKTNRTYLVVTAIVRLYMVGALAISFQHIITSSQMLGLTGWQVWTVPFFIDGFAILGMIGRSSRFAATTQRTGLYLQMVAGTLSLICNIHSGGNLGERLYGALIVAGFVAAEWYAGKLRPAPAAASTVRSEAAKKAAATRKANAAAKATAAEARKERLRLAREVKALEVSFASADAPVSPAP